LLERDTKQSTQFRLAYAGSHSSRAKTFANAHIKSGSALAGHKADILALEYKSRV